MVKRSTGVQRTCLSSERNARRSGQTELRQYRAPQELLLQRLQRAPRGKESPDSKERTFPRCSQAFSIEHVVAGFHHPPSALLFSFELVRNALLDLDWALRFAGG